MNFAQIKKDIKDGYYRVYEGRYGHYDMNVTSECGEVVILLEGDTQIGGLCVPSEELLGMKKPQFIQLLGAIIYYSMSTKELDEE